MVVTAMIHLSHSAVNEVMRLRSKCANPKALLRVDVQPTGCAGLSYTLALEDVTKPEDQVYECNSISVVINIHHLMYINGLNIDYSEDLMGGGFRFHNPNAVKTCGCGSSFAVADITPNSDY